MASVGAHTGWNVYLGGKWIDKVFYTADCNAEYVRKGLIGHDGYHPSITVRKEAR